MGRIFLDVDQAGPRDETLEKALIQISNLIIEKLRILSFNVLLVPQALELPQAIAWINRRARPDDIALQIQTNAFLNPEVRGTSVFYIANNQERLKQADVLLSQLLQAVPSLINQGVNPDTETGLGRLAFTRQVIIPSLVLNVGFSTNPTDRSLIQNRPQDIAQGIANGLVAWSRAVDQNNIPFGPYPPINISINGQIYDEQGIIVNGNAYIPVDIVERFDINLKEPTLTRLIEYGNVTYLRAVDLREAEVFVGWDSQTRSVLLRTIGLFDPKNLGEIIGSGNLSVSALEAFLRSVNPEALKQFPDIAELYLDEAASEKVNPDVAFAQALLETDFFRFSGKNKSLQNNFGGLGAIGASPEGATFSSATIGVRAHIQHLKAYANREPLVKDKVDPRFGFIRRGSAPRVELLSNRWSADPKYGEKILAILRRLYQSAGLL